MIFRDGKRVVIELPDEQKAEATLWLLKNLIPSSAETSTTTLAAPNSHRSVRPSEQKLSLIEKDRLNAASGRQREEENRRSRDPIYPWRTQKPPVP